MVAYDQPSGTLLRSGRGSQGLIDFLPEFWLLERPTRRILASLENDKNQGEFDWITEWIYLCKAAQATSKATPADAPVII